MIRILLVDKIRLVCEVIGAALEGEQDLHVVGIATDRNSALQQIDATGANLVLVSASLPEGDALALVRDAHETAPDAKLLVMGLDNVDMVILRYIEAGASGYILKEDGVAELLHNIRAAFDDKALVSPVMAGKLMARIAELAEQLSQLGMDPEEIEQLTPREKEILDLISDGLSNQEIAEELTIEVGTVKNHVHNILNKLNVNSRKDAALYAALVENEPTANERPALLEDQ